MSEHEGGDGKATVAFFLGFLLGVVLTLGGGGTFFLVRSQRFEAEAEMQRARAEEAMRDAEEARHRAEAELARAEKALREKAKPAKKGD